MIVTGSLAIRNARAVVHATALAGGAIHFYGGAMPAGGEAPAGAYAGMVVLPSPAGDVAAGAFALIPNLEAMALTNVTITWARVVDAGNNWLYDMDCGLEGSGAALELDSVDVQAGGTITVQSLILIEP